MHIIKKKLWLSDNHIGFFHSVTNQIAAQRLRALHISDCKVIAQVAWWEATFLKTVAVWLGSHSQTEGLSVNEHKSRGLNLTGCIPGEQEGLLRTHVIVKCEFTAATVTNHQKSH